MSGKVKRILWLAIRLLIVAGLVAWVISGTDMAQVAGMAPSLTANWYLVLAALAVISIQAPLSAYRWRMLLAVQDVHITFGESLRLTYIGWFFNNWMPGATGGDFVKAYYIAQQTHKKTEAVTVVFLDRIIGLVAMCMMGAAAVAVSLHDPNVRIARYLVSAFLLAALRGRHRLLQPPAAGPAAGRPVPQVAAHLADDAEGQSTRSSSTAITRRNCSYRWPARGSSRAWPCWPCGGWPTAWAAPPGGTSTSSACRSSGSAGRSSRCRAASAWPRALTQGLFDTDVLGATTVADAATLAFAMILAYRVVQSVVTLPGGRPVPYAPHDGLGDPHARRDGGP